MNKAILVLFFLLSLADLKAQETAKLIVKTSDSYTLQKLESSLFLFEGARQKEIKIRSIFPSFNLYSILVDHANKNSLINLLHSDENIIWVTQDLELDQRIIPDDEHFDRQWHLEAIEAIKSWDISRGGLSPKGDTIVLAILDDGFFYNHQDLSSNIWKNSKEIPNDNLDNDGNSYVDDYFGLNVDTQNDDHIVKKHGTSVAGVIGAEANNGIGTSGVNWNVKMLLISNANSLANVIEAYQYVLDLRKAYNESGGSEGAYIVATNLSAGIDAVFPEDNPLFQEWCNIYDALGQQGVLNVNATTNTDRNIDIDGDMPGTCNSEYLIIVTNSNRMDTKVTDAGYGATNVDLAAPGIEIYSTSLANDYDGFSGASSSAPQVTGAIGLLYAAPCITFADLALQDPAEGAQQIKNMILSGVDQNSNLLNISTSGGRLNILSSMEQLRNYCGGTTGDMEIIKIQPNPATDHLTIFFESENFDVHEFEVRNFLGQLIGSQKVYPNYFGDKSFSVRLDRISFPQGIYIASLKFGDQISSKKLMLY